MKSSFVVIIGLFLVPNVLTCDQEDAQRCLLNFGFNLGVAVLEGMEDFCSAFPTMLDTGRTCVKSSGCWEYMAQGFEQFVKMKEIYDDLICNPTADCGVLKLFSCYHDLFDKIGLDVPTDNRQTAAFIDDLPKHLYSGGDKFCKAAAEVDYDHMAQCLSEQYGELFRSCFQNSPNSQSLKPQIEASFGGLQNGDMMRQQTTAVCQPGCEDFADRYDGMKACVRDAMVDLRDTDLSSFNNDKMCSWMEDMLICVKGQTKGCKILDDQMANNPQLSSGNCGFTYADLPASARSTNSLPVVVSLFVSLAAVVLVRGG